MKINHHFEQLKPSYLFTEIVARTQAFQQSHPEAKILRMGVGDVHGPMAPAVIDALHRAVDDQATVTNFHGYGLEVGERWLRERIATFCYAPLQVTLDKDEIFVGDGAGSDLGNLSDLFTSDCRVAITDPVYPAYYDSSVMVGREVVLLPATRENGFVPMPDDTQHYDLIFLCSPGNPTGVAMTYDQVQAWVDYANRHDSVIIYDSAYEAFIRDTNVPHSIYECAGAETCAIEICSFSKLAGFTGIRCGYTVVPMALEREGLRLNALWNRRQCTKFNGASILSQQAAMAVLTDEGYAQVMAQVEEYRQNALSLKQALREKGIEVYGADNSPYVWARVEDGYDSWSYFDYMLSTHHIVCTPGAGFGRCGEGFFRLSGFSSPENTQEAIRRLKNNKR